MAATFNSTEIRRQRIKEYLLTAGHYNEERLIRGARNRSLYPSDSTDQNLLESLKLFAAAHNIKILQKPKQEISYIESIDEEGETSLQLLHDRNPSLEELLIERRDYISEELIQINKLLKIIQK